MSDVSSRQSSKFGPWSAISVTLAAFFGSQVLAGLVVGIFLALTQKSQSQSEEFLLNSTFGQFSFILVVEIFTLAILFWFLRWRKIGWADIGLGRAPAAKDAGYAAIFFGIYFLILALILAAVGRTTSIDLEQEQQIGFESATGPAALALVFISLVVLPPIVEEIMIRGFLYSGLRRKLPVIISALIASFIFGVAHLQLGTGNPPLYVAAIDTFVLSMVLIWLRERTGSIWSGMLVHAMKNGMAFVALFILNIA